MKPYLKIFHSVLFSLGISLLACQSSSTLPNSFDQRITENYGIGQIIKLFLEPRKADFFGTEVITGASEYLFLGNNQGLTSWILFRYGFSELPAPDSSKIKTVQLILHSSAAVGDSTSPFQATVHLMGNKNPEWDELEMKWSIFAQDFLPTPLSAPMDVNTVTGDSVVFDLDIQQFTTADSVLDSTIINNGLCLRSDPLQAVDALKRFYSRNISLASLRPALRIISQHLGKIDTTLDYSTQDVFIVRSAGLAADSSQFIFTGRGYPYHSLLDFDVSEIHPNATINRARLKLVLARDRSIFGLDSDLNVRLHSITNWPDAPAEVAIDSTTTGLSSTALDDTIFVELRGKVQEWSAQLEVNNGVFLRALNEGDDISRLAFYGATADSLLRPKLIVEYTIPPETEY
jgi:hypothetical protein